MAHPARDGHIRATGLPVIGNEVFDGRFRAVRQMGDERGKSAVKFFGLLRGRFFPTAASVHVIREQTTEA